MNQKVTYIEFQGEKFPVIQITETLDRSEKFQVVIRYIHQDNAHLTLHEREANILLTMFDSKHFTRSSETKVQIATNLGYENPKKHGHYLFHRLVSREKDRLAARQVILKKQKGDSKYLKQATLLGSSLVEAPVVEVTLYAVNHAEKPNGCFVETGLGELHFKIIE